MMSSGINGIADYIDDIPMKLSNNFMPKFFHIDIPVVNICINQDELVYDFSNESCAMEMAVLRQKEIEREKLLTISPLNNENDIQNSKLNFDGNLLTPKEMINTTSNLENESSELILNTKPIENNHLLRRNSVPNTIKIFQNNFDILRPQPSHYNCDLKKPSREEIIPINRIDPRDFESASSSPFDDALLKAIDEKQELNRVFQQL